MKMLYAAIVVLSTTAGGAAEGTIHLAPSPAPCPPEQVHYHDVITHRCRLVPEVKQIKKTVYEVHEVPYCLKKLPPLFSFHHRGCDDCAECDCPRYKKVLFKKEIVCEEICGTKCVIEEVIERVPCPAGAPFDPHCTIPTIPVAP
jgi:hypothetical protein